MGKWKSKFIKSIIIIAVFYPGSIVSAGIYIDGNLYSENTLSLFDSSYNNSIINLTDDSVLNIYSTVDNGVDLEFIEANDNSVINLISDEPVFVMFNLMDTFWTYEDIQISYSNYPSSIYPEVGLGMPDVAFLRGYGTVINPEIAYVDLSSDASVNIVVPEPTSLVLLLLGGIIFRKKSSN